MSILRRQNRRLLAKEKLKDALEIAKKMNHRWHYSRLLQALATSEEEKFLRIAAQGHFNLKRGWQSARSGESLE